MENQKLDNITTSVKDIAIEQSYKYLKRAFFSTLVLVACILFFYIPKLKFIIVEAWPILFILIMLFAILAPLANLIGLIYGGQASSLKVDLSNKEVWIILGNFIFLVAFIIGYARIIWLVFWEKIFAF